MKAVLKSLTALLAVSFILSFGVLTVYGEEEILSAESHNLKLSLSDDYLVLTEENANKYSEEIKAFGYTVSSFKNYLIQNNIIIFGLDTKNKTQVAVKTFETDFSKEIEELSLLSDNALNDVAKKLVTVKGASWRTAKVNGMRMIEMRYTGSDAGGNFYSVQYITVRNGKIYSFCTNFNGEKSDAKTEIAWNLVKNLNIENVTVKGAWTPSAIFEFAVIWVIIVIAAAAAVVIIVSFIRDRKRTKMSSYTKDNTISRRK